MRRLFSQAEETPPQAEERRWPTSEVTVASLLCCICGALRGNDHMGSLHFFFFTQHAYNYKYPFVKTWFIYFNLWKCRHNVCYFEKTFGLFLNVGGGIKAHLLMMPQTCTEGNKDASCPHCLLSTCFHRCVNVRSPNILYDKVDGSHGGYLMMEHAGACHPQARVERLVPRRVGVLLTMRIWSSLQFPDEYFIKM